MTTLYHYTNAAGLDGILGEKSFWASEHRFLNDSSEFVYGKEIVLFFLKKYREDISKYSPDIYLMIESLSEYTSRRGVVGFVASFTTEGDLLSQRRGYNGGRGYAIGINQEWLKFNATVQGFSLFPILYGRESQEKAADNAFSRLLELLRSCDGDNARMIELTKQWWQDALKLAFAFKDSNFSEEREFRLSHISESWPPSMKTRTGPQGIVPYIQCFFNKTRPKLSLVHPSNFGLEKIIVGPALRETQKLGAEAVQAKNHMRFEIVKSCIPYVAD